MEKFKRFLIVYNLTLSAVLLTAATVTLVVALVTGALLANAIGDASNPDTGTVPTVQLPTDPTPSGWTASKEECQALLKANNTTDYIAKQCYMYSN